jgi:hypothetical protein
MQNLETMGVTARIEACGSVLELRLGLGNEQIGPLSPFAWVGLSRIEHYLLDNVI